MAFQKGKHWFADWRDEFGTRRRKSFTKKGDAAMYESKERAFTDLIVAAGQVHRAVPPKRRAEVSRIIRSAKELRTA